MKATAPVCPAQGRFATLWGPPENGPERLLYCIGTRDERGGNKPNTSGKQNKGLWRSW